MVAALYFKTITNVVQLFKGDCAILWIYWAVGV